METKTFKQRHFVCLLQYSRFDSVIFLPPLNLWGPSSCTIFEPPTPSYQFCKCPLIQSQVRSKDFRAKRCGRTNYGVERCGQDRLGGRVPRLGQARGSGAVATRSIIAMYKIYKRGGGVQKSFFRKLPILVYKTFL